MKSWTRFFSIASLCVLASTALGQNKGFQINRYEPTSAGEWAFMVDHPWYTRSRSFAAAGLTLNYAHDPLVFGVRTGSSFTAEQEVIRHQLIGHLDLAASFLDRVTLSASLPIVFLERGTAAGGVSPSGAAVGDLRLGLMVRVYGQPLTQAFSVHLGAQVWAPIAAGSDHAGESGVRVLVPKLVLAGLKNHILWSASGAFFYRPDATIGDLPTATGNTVGSELRIGGAIAYMDVERRFSVGPELLVSSVVTGGHFFKKDFTSLELLAGAMYNIVGQVQVGIAAGLGLLREPGTPDARVLFRLAYAPMRREAKKAPADRDHDGILDAVDACPDVYGVASTDPRRNGCPKVVVIDRIPDADTDLDGVVDRLDACPLVPMGAHRDPKRLGCPADDRDHDGVYDPEDLCPELAAGDQPDPSRIGCPSPDQDGDHVVDRVDACPDKPGAPDLDPKKNGCPGLATIAHGQIVILDQVYFATAKDIILPKSFPVLQAVANVVLASPDMKRLSIEGHTDNRGKPAANLQLSERRAQSVMRWLSTHGIEASRLEAHGYGQTRPIEANTSEAGRAKNRRVEFHIGATGETEQ